MLQDFLRTPFEPDALRQTLALTRLVAETITDHEADVEMAAGPVLLEVWLAVLLRTQAELRMAGERWTSIELRAIMRVMHTFVVSMCERPGGRPYRLGLHPLRQVLEFLVEGRDLPQEILDAELPPSPSVRFPRRLYSTIAQAHHPGIPETLVEEGDPTAARLVYGADVWIPVDDLTAYTLPEMVRMLVDEAHAQHAHAGDVVRMTIERYRGAGPRL